MPLRPLRPEPGDDTAFHDGGAQAYPVPKMQKFIPSRPPSQSEYEPELEKPDE